jgi:hypothetical protein
MKRKSKTFGAVRKPSGRVVIEGLTPWHVDHLENSLNEFAIDNYLNRKSSVTQKTISWAANELSVKLDRNAKSLTLKPVEIGVLVLTLSIYTDPVWLNLKSQLHRYML